MLVKQINAENLCKALVTLRRFAVSVVYVSKKCYFDRSVKYQFSNLRINNIIVCTPTIINTI